MPLQSSNPFLDQIARQEADPNSPITAFRAQFAFLSNFYPARVVYEGVQYPTTEHAYQAAKMPEAWQRDRLLHCPTPGAAKRLAAIFSRREDWDAVKVSIMRDLLRQKFVDPMLHGRLLETGDRPIEEHNYWGDTFWGCYRGQGQNRLGRLLMTLRDELRTTPLQDTPPDVSLPGVLIIRIQQLMALWQRCLTGHHKDRDCHMYLNLAFSYSGELHCHIQHYGYVAHEWDEEYRTPSIAAQRLIDRLIHQIRVHAHCSRPDQENEECGDLRILHDLDALIKTWDSQQPCHHDGPAFGS